MSDRETVQSPHSSIPLGLIGAILLVIGVETWISRNELEVATLGITAAHYADGAVAKALSARVLVMGDSLAKFGVLPRVIEERNGTQTYNLGVRAASSPLTYYLLKHAIERGARPSALVVTFKPTQLQMDPKEAVSEFSIALSVRECFDMAWQFNDPPFFLHLLSRRYLVSMRNRWEIRNLIKSLCEGAPVSLLPVNVASFRNWNVNKGAGLFSKNPNAETQAVFWDEPIYELRGSFWNHPLSAIYLRRFLELAAAQKIPVYWLAPPIHPRVQARRDLMKYDARYDALVDRALDLYPNLTFLDGRRTGYPLRLFKDGAHLDFEGAYTFSHLLAPFLLSQRSSTGSRRLNLPRFEPVSSPPDLEDESDSQLALFGTVLTHKPRLAGASTRTSR